MFGGIEFLFAGNGKVSGSAFIESGGCPRPRTKGHVIGLPTGIAAGAGFIIFGGRTYF